jgi:2-dehydropantoate 2-reductase
MKIAIIGTGGVGDYFGGRMANAGYDVTFVARGEHMKAMQANGLMVKSILGDFLARPVKATDNFSELTNRNLILVCVKA